MLTEQEMKIDRSGIIGGSDIAAVMGLSRFKTSLALWAEKTGKLTNELSNFEAAEIGTELEEYVANKFQRRTGIKLRRDQRTFRHPVYNYMVAHIDRWVLNEDAIFEAKTTSAWKAKEWEGDQIPQEFILQVMWYLGILGKKTGYIAVLIGGQKFLYKQIFYDQELFYKQVESARNFMEEFVERDVPPIAVANDQETISKLFPHSKDHSIRFEGEKGLEIDEMVKNRSDHLRILKSLETEIDDIEAKLKQKIGEAAFMETEQFTVSWNSQQRISADLEKLKAEGIFEKYQKTTSSRVLRIKKREGV